MTTRPNETCRKCGKRFECGGKAADAKCWCVDLPWVLRVTPDSCFCPDCLREEIARADAARRADDASRA